MNFTIGLVLFCAALAWFSHYLGKAHALLDKRLDDLEKKIDELGEKVDSLTDKTDTSGTLP